MNKAIFKFICDRCLSRLRYYLKQEGGQALPIAMGALALGALIIGPFLSHASASLISSGNYSRISDESYSADAGIEHAIWSLTGGSLSSQIPDQGDQTVYTLSNHINGFAPHIIVINRGNSGGTATNYHVQSEAGDVSIVTSVNIDSGAATIISWECTNTK